jgi:hypothetical protein
MQHEQHRDITQAVRSTCNHRVMLASAVEVVMPKQSEGLSEESRPVPTGAALRWVSSRHRAS